MITTGETSPAGNEAEIVFRPSTDSASVRKVSAWLRPKLVVVVPRDSPASSSTDADRDPDRLPGGGQADPPPAASGLLAVRVVRVDLRYQRPEDSARADDQRRGQHQQPEQQRRGDADRPAQAQAPGCPQSGQQQGEQGQDHGGRRGGDRGRRTQPGRAHGGPAVRRTPQLLAVAGDQQQGVVGAGAEDQHRDDAADVEASNGRSVTWEAIAEQRARSPGRPGRPRPAG